MPLIWAFEMRSLFMTARHVAPVLLAGTLLLSGLVAPAAQARIEDYPTSRPEDTRLTGVDQLVDVSPNHWAYDALTELVDRYDVIEGYKGKDSKYRFKGNQAVTRYEMAAALRDILRSKELAPSDLNVVNKLKQEFANELASLDARTGALETRTAALEDRVGALGKVKLGGDFTVGGLSNFSTGEENAASDFTSMVSRLRLTVEAPVVESKEDSYLGEGRLKARLVAAVGNNGTGYNGLSRIAADSSSSNEALGSGNANTRLNAYFDRAVYEQDIKHGVPVISNLYLAELLGKESDDPNWQAGGTFFAGLIQWRDYFDKSAYRGDENFQFQNNAFVNIPGLASNLSSTSVGYAMFQNLGENAKLNVTAAYGAHSPVDAVSYYSASYEV
jgi:hypothetical protein